MQPERSIAIANAAEILPATVRRVAREERVVGIGFRIREEEWSRVVQT